MSCLLTAGFAAEIRGRGAFGGFDTQEYMVLQKMDKSFAESIKLDSSKELPVIGVKILDEQYANQFIKEGKIYFPNPKVWRDPESCSGKQLDEDEGCFCFSTEPNDNIYNALGRKYERTFKNGGWKYFENTDAIVGSCFYGILKSSFIDYPMQYGVKRIMTKGTTVPVHYFKSLNGYERDSHKKSVVIFDLYKFYDRIIEKVTEMGAKREEIFISPVYYVNKSKTFCTLESFPFEYFLKDESFSEQSELRIIIASKNEGFYKCLNNNKNVITIGDISSFSVLQDTYDSDLDFSIQGDKLAYKLASPISVPLEQRTFKELIIELYQILQNQLPGEPKNKNELELLANPIIEYLKSKYGVEFRDDWRLYSVPYDEYLTLPDLYKGMCIMSDKLI